MTHLIDKDAVVAEIERLKECNRKICAGDFGFLKKTNPEHYYSTEIYNEILSFIDTLEVKEVDLEKEIEKCLKKYTMLVRANDFTDIAKHFFELGLKVKQESNDDVKIGETQIYLEDDGGEPPYDGKQWLDLSCTEYEIPKTIFKDGDNVEVLIRKVQKGE